MITPREKSQGKYKRRQRIFCRCTWFNHRTVLTFACCDAVKASRSFTVCNWRFLGRQLQCTWSSLHSRVGGRRYITSWLLERIYMRAARFAYERKWDSKCQLGGFIPWRTMRKLCKSELSSRIDFSNIDLAYADTANYYKRSRQSGEMCESRAIWLLT